MPDKYRFVPHGVMAFAKTLATIMAFNRNHGVYRSLRRDEPVEGSGERVPWFTYPAIEYLAAFDFSDRVLFEYGAGQSTLYWAKRFKRVVSVEHDEQWFVRIRDLAPTNATILFAPAREEYVRAIEQLNRACDVVVIDGMWRRECAQLALQCLSPDGMIILDNADWYPTIAEQMRANGLLEVDFSGFSPLAWFATTTSFFFRPSTILQRGFHNPQPIGGPKGGELVEGGV